MRILTLTNTYPPHYYGGYELTCRDVMDRFAARGHDVHVLTSDVRVPDVTDTAQPQVTRTLAAYWDWERNAATVPLSPLARLRIEQHNNREFQLVVERVRPDVVSVWHMGALSLSLLTAAECRGLPMVLTVANEWLWTGPLLDGWARLWRHLPAQPRAVGGVATRLPALDGATVNFVSAFTKQQTIDAKVPWDLHDAPVVHPGIEAADFGPPDASELDNDWSWRVLYVGRIVTSNGCVRSPTSSGWVIACR
jgi:glycosyltransferase involved in cell wall biosynthesis